MNESVLPKTMHAVHLTGHGGPDKLVYRTDVPVPEPAPGELLIRVAAAGVNNTDINTRIGWYSKSVQGPTEDAGAPGADDDGRVDDDGAWSGQPLQFPRIQGADLCGEVVAAGDAADAGRIGERVVVRSMMAPPASHAGMTCWTFGSECDGAFAQFAVAPARETYRVNSDWSDVELASLPCAYSTAENMLHRAEVAKERVLVTGASGGVGSAAVQLARRRGATVVAVAGASKHAALLELGANSVLDRGGEWLAELTPGSFDVVVDLVGGGQWPGLLDILRNRGRYVTSGAIAGPIVPLDLRTLYLKDLALLGATAQDPAVFSNLVGYVERNEIRPLVAATYPLADIQAAQADFMAKRFVGKLVLIPPSLTT